LLLSLLLSIMGDEVSIRVFELVTFLSDVPGKIKSLDTCGGRVYIGTHDGAILKYAVSESKDAAGKTTFRCELEGKRVLGSKPVDRIVTVREFAILVALCGGKVEVMNLYSLQPKGGLQLKAPASHVCVQHPVHSFRLCVQVQSSVQFYEILGCASAAAVAVAALAAYSRARGGWRAARCARRLQLVGPAGAVPRGASAARGRAGDRVDHAQALSGPHSRLRDARPELAVPDADDDALHDAALAPAHPRHARRAAARVRQCVSRAMLHALAQQQQQQPHSTHMFWCWWWWWWCQSSASLSTLRARSPAAASRGPTCLWCVPMQHRCSGSSRCSRSHYELRLTCSLRAPA